MLDTSLQAARQRGRLLLASDQVDFKNLILCWITSLRTYSNKSTCLLNFRAMCKPARRGSGRGTHIHCQHSQLSGVEDREQVLAMVQGVADQPPSSRRTVFSDDRFIGRRNETKTRLDPINKRQCLRMKRKSFRETASQPEQTLIGQTIMKRQLFPIKTEPAYSQNSSQAATAQIFVAPPMARNGGSQTNNLTRQEKPSAGPTISLQTPRPTTSSVIRFAKNPFEVSRPITLDRSSWKDGESVPTIPLPRCSTPKIFSTRSTPVTTTSNNIQLEPTYCGPSGTVVEGMPKNFLRAEMQFSMQMCEKWQQDNPKLVQGVPLPSWLDAAELKVEGKSREADDAGETEGRSRDRESDFLKSLFDFSGDELERLSHNSGDDWISFANPQSPEKTSTSLDVGLRNGDFLHPQATLPSDMCGNDFIQFFDNQPTQLQGDYFEARRPTEVEAEDQDLTKLWSGYRANIWSPRELPPASPSRHSDSPIDTRPVLLHFRGEGKEESGEKDEDDPSHGRATKLTKEKPPISVTPNRVKSEAKVLQRRE